MPRDSNGNTNPLPGTIVQTGDTILPSQHNPALVDLYAMMTQSLSRDGQGGMRANLAMNGFQVTGLGSATQPGNAVPLSQFQSGTPVGSVVDFAGVTAPNTWMLCFGQAIEVAAYPEFVAACYVGNALNATAGFGYRTTSQTDPSANRSTSGQYIVLPDLRGRVAAGKDDMGGTAAGRITSSGSEGVDGLIIGSAGGKQNYNISISQLPAHSHTGTTAVAGEHFHGVRTNNNANAGNQGIRAGDTPPTSGVTQNTESAGSHVHTFTTDNTGSGNAVPILQPTTIINKIIKVSY